MIQEQIELIPINEIRVTNPRSRNKQVFQTIVSNIRAVGLKRPITVCRRTPDSDGTQYDLACGQGRLEALIELGEKKIPAIVVEAPPEQQLLMSLIENIARRPPSNRDLLREIKTLRERGHKTTEIARKLGLDRAYILGIVKLLERGEEGLVEAVEAKRLPITIAVTIAGGNDEELRRALTLAYEKGDLRGAKLISARRIIAQRLAKQRGTSKVRQFKRKISADALVRDYQRHAEKNRKFINKAATTSQRVALLIAAIRQLLADEHFVTLLRAESLTSMPECLSARLGERGN